MDNILNRIKKFIKGVNNGSVRNSHYLFPEYGNEQITFGDRIRDIWNGIIHSTPWETDPLLIDLNRDGIKTTMVSRWELKQGHRDFQISCHWLKTNINNSF